MENKTIGQILHWAYANLAISHIAYKEKVTKYELKHYGIRAKLFKGFESGETKIRSFFDDERLKMILPQSCNYCGSIEHLAADHLIPRKKGGQDIGENLVWACRTCNSSKSDTDVLKWMNKNNQTPSILLYRRYLKNAITYSKQNDLMDKVVTNEIVKDLPFDINSILSKPIEIDSLKLWIDNIENDTFRIANWNLERPKHGSKKTELALEKINSIDADILILTETSDAINLEPKYMSVVSDSFARTPNEQWITIWSKWYVKEQIDTFDPKRTTCALIDSPFGDLIVYGTIIPYHMAGVSGERYEFSGYKPWQLHEEDIVRQSEDWKKIISDNPKVPFVLAGDFNQTRDNLTYGYGTKTGRSLLTQKLKELGLSCLTGIDFSETGQLSIDKKKGKVRRNIDHICVSSDWLTKLKKHEVGAWDHFDDTGFYLSDHNGVFLDFETK